MTSSHSLRARFGAPQLIVPVVGSKRRIAQLLVGLLWLPPWPGHAQELPLARPFADEARSEGGAQGGDELASGERQEPAPGEPGAVLSDALPDGYRALVDEAIAARNAGRSTRAQQLLREAHSLFPNARTLRGLGVLAMDLHLYQEAVAQLEAALDSRERPLQGSLRDVTEELLARARAQLTRLYVTVQPPYAQVQLDGDPARLPGEQLVSTGEHALLVRAAGFVDERRTLQVGGEELRLRIALRPLPRVAARAQERSSPWRSPWLWGAVSLVVAGGVTGIVVAARREQGYEGGSSRMIVGQSR